MVANSKKLIAICHFPDIVPERPSKIMKAKSLQLLNSDTYLRILKISFFNKWIQSSCGTNSLTETYLYMLNTQPSQSWKKISRNNYVNNPFHQQMGGNICCSLSASSKWLFIIEQCGKKPLIPWTIKCRFKTWMEHDNYYKFGQPLWCNQKYISRMPLTL